MSAARSFGATTLHDGTLLAHGQRLQLIDALDYWSKPNTECHDDNIPTLHGTTPTNRCSIRVLVAGDPSNASRVIGALKSSNDVQRLEGVWEKPRIGNDLNGPHGRVVVNVPRNSARRGDSRWHKLQISVRGIEGISEAGTELSSWPIGQVAPQRWIFCDEGHSLARGRTVLPRVIQKELDEFSNGVGSVRPELRVVEMATRLAQVAVRYTRNPDITTDVDGELSFYVRLNNGQLVMAELAVDGSNGCKYFRHER